MQQQQLQRDHDIRQDVGWMQCMADDSTCSFRAVDLRLGVREHLWLAGFCCVCFVSHPTQFKVICVCALVRQSVSLCVFRFGRAASVWLCRVLSLATHARPSPSPTPRSISQSIKCLLPVFLCSLPGNNRLCVYKLSMFIIRGGTTLTQSVIHRLLVRHFPRPFLPKRPALSLLRALQQCSLPAPAHVPLWSWSCHFPCFPPLARPGAGAGAGAVTITAPVLSFPACQTVPGTSAKCRARIDRL